MLALCFAGLGARWCSRMPLLRGAIQWGGHRLPAVAGPEAGAQPVPWTQADSIPPERGFLAQGVALQFLNIKAWTLALTVVAQWLAGQTDSYTRFAAVLPVMLAYAFSSNLAYAVLGSSLRRWLSGPVRDGQPSYLRLRSFNRTMAALLLATALWMSTL